MTTLLKMKSTHKTKNLIKSALILSLCFGVSTCDKSVNNDRVVQDCPDLQNGIISIDRIVVVSEINMLVTDLVSAPTTSDYLGHRENLNLLIERINEGCENVSAELHCYACIETYPQQSEIKVITDSSGSEIVRIIDIVTPKDDTLSCRSIHRY